MILTFTVCPLLSDSVTHSQIDFWETLSPSISSFWKRHYTVNTPPFVLSYHPSYFSTTETSVPQHTHWIEIGDTRCQRRRHVTTTTVTGGVSWQYSWFTLVVYILSTVFVLVLLYPGKERERGEVYYPFSTVVRKFYRENVQKLSLTFTLGVYRFE